MGDILDAVGLFGRNPRLWRYSLRPLLISAVLFVLVIGLGFVPFVTVVPNLSGSRGIVAGIAGLAYIVVMVLAAGTLFLAIAGFVCSLGFDQLSMEVERLTVGTSVGQALPMTVAALDGFQRFVFTLVVSSFACCIGLFLAGVPGIFAAGLISLFDFTSQN